MFTHCDLCDNLRFKLIWLPVSVAVVTHLHIHHHLVVRAHRENVPTVVQIKVYFMI